MTAPNPTVVLNEWRRSAPGIADGLAAAVAAALPWSTSATGILIALWLVASLPALDAKALRREVTSAVGGLPVLLALLGIVGLAWADASASERLRGVEPFLRLLMIPVLFVQFQRSVRASWVALAFLASSTVLLAASLAMVLFAYQNGHGPGVPIRDYMSQSGMFVLCGFGLLDFAAGAIKHRPIMGAASAALALLFLGDIAYVTTSRTTLVIIPVLYAVWGLHRLPWRRLAAFLLAGLVMGAALWFGSPEVREHINRIPAEIAEHQATGADTSSGARLEFWKESLDILRAAPLFGHGTGTIAETFRRHATATDSAPATNPHNQLFAIGIQIGALGMAALLAMWGAHFLLFLWRGPWIGLMAVTQNIVGSLFNSHLMDFTQSWVYVFAVGVFGGLALREPSFPSRGDEGGAGRGEDRPQATGAGGNGLPL
jgi:O-antigen ligase